MSEALERRMEARRRAELVSNLRRLARPAAGRAPVDRAGANGDRPAEERCDLCGNEIPSRHRHLLHLTERRILCACEPCLALRSGDPELRPTGTRTTWLEDFELSEELWARFAIPIGLAVFMLDSVAGRTVAFYPSPAGPTESELDLDAWEELREANPVLASLEPDVESLIVNRIARPPEQVIVPIDECYRLVGMIKACWDGITGGAGPEQAIERFFAEQRRRGAAG
ncbi:MAG TPA: DUF5947 family protein [Solirubrobacterales bacterium]|nr:DUF5947 family protein [Solirubrobacterales bacterium]